ncbi:MAG: glycosyltransferase family 4 protein [Microgenomates group bacterium]
MKISFIRGAYLNNFEGQNFDFTHQTSFDFRGYSSLFPLDAHVPFPIVRLPSITDIPLIAKPVRFVANRTLGDTQLLFGLERHITSSDIVHTADPHYYYSYQAALLRQNGMIKKLITTWWETIAFNNEGTSAKKRIKKFVMQHTDLFLCYTERAKQCLLDEGVAHDKIAVIPLGVDLAKFYPMAKKNAVPTILFAGRLVQEKGILDLYDAFLNIKKQNIVAKLRIVGSGPLEGELRSRIMEDKLADAVSIEKRTYEEMPKIYREADIFCVPSKKTKTWEEQYGMVFIEAMASGLPIVSYRTGAIPEVVGECGLFADEGDISVLTASIIQIIRARELGAKLGTMGREQAANRYDAKRTALQIAKLYTTLCK